MYESMKERVDLEDGSWKELKWQIYFDLDGWTSIYVTIRNNPVKLFKFFESEKIKLKESKYSDLKKRNGKKFLKFLKENCKDIRDTVGFLRLIDNLDLNKRYSFRQVKVGYGYNIIRHG